MDASNVLQVNNRKQVVSILKKLYEKGYRYVVRDNEMPYLICYSLKPKKYRDVESWGYVNPDVEKVLMAYPIKNLDIGEIHWSNKSATLIKEFTNRHK